jgi:glycosyltransferase involved in cell wall biosynthesis
MKLVCISNNPFPYHTPILNQLNRLVDLHVVYMAKTHPLGSFIDDWGEQPQFSASFHWSKPLGSPHLDIRAQMSLGISRRLQRLRPDVILFSSWGPLVLEPVLWKLVARKRSVMWAESTRFSGLLRGKISNGMRRFIVSNTDAFVANGSQAALYLGDLGVPRQRIITSCLPSPVTCCAPAKRAQPDPAGATRYLFVGRLIERKQPLQLLDAFAIVRQQLPRARLTIVGDGPLQAQVEAGAQPFGTGVQLLGRREGTQLAEVYRQADILVVPSVREVWGLVVNEALAHGLYVIATDQVGAAFDLLDGQSGQMVPAGRVQALATAMIDAAVARSSPAAPAPAQPRVSTCTPEAFAQGLLRGAQIALGLEDR